MPVALDVKNRAAFEFSKRKFVSQYGPDLPVWALLVSGSTGGVRLAFSLSMSRFAFDLLLQIAYWLSSYPLGKSATNSACHLIPHPSFLKTSSSRAYSSARLLQVARLSSTLLLN
jgi:hypothetical protein